MFEKGINGFRWLKLFTNPFANVNTKQNINKPVLPEIDRTHNQITDIHWFDSSAVLLIRRSGAITYHNTQSSGFWFCHFAIS